MDPLLTAFDSFLKNKGLRFTEPRRQIVEKVLTLHTHFTAEELYEQLKNEYGHISKATLYRTLALLTESNVLEAQDFGAGSNYYEHKLGHTHHDHMVCLKCNRIIEFKDDKIEAAQDAMAKKLRFKPRYHTLKIYGTCSRCLGT